MKDWPFMNVPTIKHGLSLTHNRVKPGDLHLIYCDYWHTWSRTLYSFNGTFVEVDLTTTNPRRLVSWEKVKGINIRRHTTRHTSADKRYACVQPGSIIYEQVLAEMTPYLSKEKIAELLHREFLPEIDWDKFYKYNNGGVFFRDCIKTWS